MSGSDKNTVDTLITQLELFNGGAENGEAVVEAALELLIAIAREENMRQITWLLSLLRERFRREMSGA